MADVEDEVNAVTDDVVPEESVVPEDASKPETAEEDHDTVEAAALAAIPIVPLTTEIISKSLSLIARTGNGLSFAYTRLEVHGKGITTLDGLEKFPHLRYIDVAENSLISIEGLFSLEFLLAADLHANQIRAIPAVLDRKKYLQHVNLAKNLIQDLKIVSWPICSWLNLNENRFKEIVLEQFPELLHLEARGNQIKDIGKWGTPKLQRLYLAANELTKISNLDSKPNLQVLHLRNNKIDSLDGFSDKLKSLTYINLRANQIGSFDQINKLQVLPSLKMLSLAENPIDQLENYRLEVILRLPHLDKLDKEAITAEERDDALSLKSDA